MDLPVADASGNDSTYQLFLAEQHSFQKWIALRADTRRSPADAYRACHFVIHRIRYICICNRLHCAATHTNQSHIPCLPTLRPLVPAGSLKLKWIALRRGTHRRRRAGLRP